MIRVAFHIDNFETTDNNLYTLLAIIWNNKLLNNQSVVIYDNDYGPIKELFFSNTIKQYKSADINVQLNESRSRLLYKFESIKEGEKSVLSHVTLVPLVSHNPEDMTALRETYNFGNILNATGGENTPQFSQFKNNIQQACQKINSYGYVYDNKFVMVLHGNIPEEQHGDICVNFVPNIVEGKISTMKKELGFRVDERKDKGQKKTYKYKLTCNWMSSEELYNSWSRMYSKGVIDLVHTLGDDYDFLVIVNRPNCNYVPEKSIVYRMEPYIENNKYYNEWNKYDKEQFMYFMEHEQFRNNTEWWIANAKDTPIQKDKLISTVISSQYDMVGHKFRVDFVKYFQQHSKYEVDTYGYYNKHDFKNYKGKLPEREKDTGLFPYKYTIAVENCDITNYFTEKLYDAIISECLCFYWGCNNVEKFIDPRVFIRLDKDDLQKSLEIVEKAIENDEWFKRIDIIRQEKKRIMDHFNIFTRTSSLIYIDKHMKFHMNGDVPFITNNRFQVTDVDMSIQDNVKYCEFMLRNYNQTSLKVQNYLVILEHYNLWKKCSTDVVDYCIVQGEPKNNFIDHLCTLLSHTASSGGYDICGLHETISNGYIITPDGARKLVNLVNTYGIFTDLDNLLDSKNYGIVVQKSFKDLVKPHNPVEDNLFINLFKNVDGMLVNKEELFKNRELDPNMGNVMVVLDF